MDISILISIASSVVAVAGAVTGIYIARSTRHKNEADAATAITDAAKNIVEMREKDAKDKEAQITDLRMEVRQLRSYVDYLYNWLMNHCGSEKEPLTFEEFVIRA